MIVPITCSNYNQHSVPPPHLSHTSTNRAYRCSAFLCVRACGCGHRPKGPKTHRPTDPKTQIPKDQRPKESKTKEQTTQRPVSACVLSLSVFPCVSLSLSLSLSFPCVSLCLSVSLCVSVSCCVSLCLAVPLCVSLSHVSLSLCRPDCLYVCQSVCLSDADPGGVAIAACHAAPVCKSPPW